LISALIVLLIYVILFILLIWALEQLLAIIGAPARLRQVVYLIVALILILVIVQRFGML
jgi:hypothetical protein